MTSFDRNNNSRSGYRGRSSFGDRNRGGYSPRGRSSFRSDRGNEEKQMFKAVCDNCGKECQVPFRPTSGKPVYCSDCFEKMGGRNSDSPREERSSFRPRFQSSDNNKAQIDAINAKLDKILGLLEVKTEEKISTSAVIDPTSTQSSIEVNIPKLPKVIKKTKTITSEV